MYSPQSPECVVLLAIQVPKINFDVDLFSLFVCHSVRLQLFSIT